MLIRKFIILLCRISSRGALIIGNPNIFGKKDRRLRGSIPGLYMYIDHTFFFFGDRESRLLITEQLLELLFMPLLTTRETVPFALSIALPHICELFSVSMACYAIC
jgi:hypothetical protein